MASDTLTARPDRNATVRALPLPGSSDRLHTGSDDDLLVRTARGDRAAYEALYGRVARQVFGVARRVLRDPSISEEVAQEVLVEIWAKADRFDPDRGTAAGWITTLTHRRAVDRVRSEQAARNREDRVGRRDQTRAFDQVLEEVETQLEHEQVRAAVAGLTERQREAVMLAYFEGFTYREVAEVLGIPEGTAKSRLRDALANLRATLEQAA